MTPDEALEELEALAALVLPAVLVPTATEDDDEDEEDDDSEGLRLALNGAPACTARSKRTGKPCRQAAIRYTDRCRFHCGTTLEKAREIANRRISYAALAAIEDNNGPLADRLIAMLPMPTVDEILAAETESVARILDAAEAPVSQNVFREWATPCQW